MQGGHEQGKRSIHSCEYFKRVQLDLSKVREESGHGLSYTLLRSSRKYTWTRGPSWKLADVLDAARNGCELFAEITRDAVDEDDEVNDDREAEFILSCYDWFPKKRRCRLKGLTVTATGENDNWHGKELRGFHIYSADGQC